MAGGNLMAKSPNNRPRSAKSSREPAQPRERPEIVHTSLYVPKAVYQALREIAFKEDCKVHDLVMEGIDLALGKRGYPSFQRLKGSPRRQ
jgi:hypothetical protein